MQNKITAKYIMEYVEQKVRDNESISPSQWISYALRVNQLSHDIDNLLANYEAQINAIEAEFIKQDIPASKAKILAKNEIDYKDYLIQKALANRIKEFIMLAKKRAITNDL